MHEIIDVRSDTVTKPTPQMLEAMMQAKVGDDVFGEDETVNNLQQLAAQTFGFEAAIFCPSGTMTNQIAIKIHTQPGDEVICDKLSHVYLYEGGGIAFHSGASVKLVQGNYGIFKPEDVVSAINKDDPHFPRTSLVCIENSVNKGGGTCWTINEMKAIKQVCHEYGLALHLDGARVFNAIVAKNQNPADYGAVFDTMSVCLSKGLGAPVGSLLLGSKQHIQKAVRYRKVFGGGMRQAGYLAAAGIYALQNHVKRLKLDHQKAMQLKQHLQALPYIADIYPVETNIVIFKTTLSLPDDYFLQKLAQHHIKAVSMGKNTFRFVMHLDITDEKFDRLLKALSEISDKE